MSTPPEIKDRINTAWNEYKLGNRHKSQLVMMEALIHTIALLIPKPVTVDQRFTDNYGPQG